MIQGGSTMKKFIIYLLSFIMILSPVAAFAEEGTDEPSDGTPVAEEPANEEQGEEAIENPEETVAPEEAVIPDEEVTPEENVAPKEAVAPEESTSNEAKGSAATEEDEQIGVKDVAHWDDSRTHYYDAEGNLMTGLFKAPREDGGLSLFYGEPGTGEVKRQEKFIKVSASDGTRFVHINTEDGSWQPVSDSATYGYAITNHNGEYFVHYQAGLVSVGSSKYYVQSNGTVRLNAGVQAVGSDKYYIQDGGAIRTSNGFVNDTNGTRYYIDGNLGGGKIKVTGGTFNYDGKTWYAAPGGAVRTSKGVFKSAVANYKYYAYSDGHIKMTKGFVKYNGKRYYVGTNGGIKLTASIIKVGKNKYYNTSSGAIRTKVGKVKVNGKFYFVKNKKTGAIALNKAVKYKGKLYHAKKSGVLAVGVHKWKDKKYYYGNPKSGAIKQSRGIVSKGSKYYFVQKGGKIAVNTKISYKGKGYIASKKGAFYTGLFNWRGAKYYADKKGTLKTKAGFIKVNGKTYFVFAGGRVAINSMYTYQGKTYIADGNGQPRKGLINYNGSTYYAGNDGVVVTNRGFIPVNGKEYYVQSGGKIAKSTFVRDNGNYFYVGSNGAVVKTSFTYNGVTVKPNSSTGEISKEDYQNAINGNTSTSDDA